MITARPKNRRRGQAFVESALVILPFLAILVGALDFGQVLFFHQALVERVGTGLRWGAVHPYDETSIKNVIRYNQSSPPAGSQPFLGLSGSNITVSLLGAGTTTERIQITIVDFQFQFVSFGIAKTFTNNQAVVETMPTEYRP
jgi:TadE-like protein